MQIYKEGEIVSGKQGSIKDLLGEGGEKLKSGKADRIVIGYVTVGDTFELNGLKFRITDKMSRGRIKAKLIGE